MRGAGLGLATPLLLMLGALASGATPAALAQGEAATHPPDDGAACFEVPAAVRYMHAMQDRILDAWKLPEDSLANRSVVLSLRVDGDGTLLKYELLSYSDRRLARSVKFAVMGASPFDPLPIEALCLRGRDIVTTFGNPARVD